MGFFKSKRKLAEQLMATGSRGAGTVVQVEDTGMTINDDPRVKMTFRVEPLDGSPAFDANKTTTVSRLSIPRQGERYPVWYDPQDTSKWMYATIADDTGRQTMRQMFGEVAETFVGMGAPDAPAAAAGAPQVQDTVEQLKQLADLHNQGLLTDDEFEQQKAKLLG
jgi:Short C-terminal domain